jgi:N-acetylglutamate synthase-like GNAT family acetyltransferase
VAKRPPRLVAQPLAAWERDGLAAALSKAGLSTENVRDPSRLFWRFHEDDVPVGFGGLEIHGDAALMHSLVTLPPLRGRGVGRAIVRALELEVPRHCRAIYLLTADKADFFERLGYAKCLRSGVPKAIQATPQFAALLPTAAAMMKRLG